MGATLRPVQPGSRLIRTDQPGHFGPYDAVVREEDSYGVLSADPRIRHPGRHPIRVMTEMHAQQPMAPGGVHVREGRPLVLLAVVHDLGQEPSCREQWIIEALEGIRVVCRDRRLRRILFEPLGEAHGTRRGRRFAELLEDALGAGGDGWPDTVVLSPGRLDSA